MLLDFYLGREDVLRALTRRAKQQYKNYSCFGGDVKLAFSGEYSRVSEVARKETQLYFSSQPNGEFSSALGITSRLNERWLYSKRRSLPSTHVSLRLTPYFTAIDLNFNTHPNGQLEYAIYVANRLTVIGCITLGSSCALRGNNRYRFLLLHRKF